MTLGQMAKIAAKHNTYIAAKFLEAYAKKLVKNG